LKAIRVLYIDDESDTEKMSSKFDILKDNNIEVTPVTKVEDVLPTLSKLHKSIDIVILDIIMPPEDYYSIDETAGGTTTGLRLLQDIRTGHSNLPIIIVSIKRTETADSAVEKYSVAEYLEKPVEALEIADAIKNVLGVRD
jgi:DNA-binding NtrC family response regulator